MNAVATWLIGVTVLFAAALFADAILARRRPLMVSAMWNAVLVAALAIGPAAWLLPRMELAVLPAEQPIVRTAKNLEWVRVTPNGDVVVQPGPPAPAPKTFALTPGNYAQLPPASAFVRLPQRPRPVAWADCRADVGATLAVIYGAGLILFLVRLVWHVRAIAVLRRRASVVEAMDWLARLDHWRRSVAPWRAVALLQSNYVSVPIVLGWRHPAIVIPESLAEETDKKTIDAILIHELAHVERADCGWQLVERVVQIAYWFHPLVWLAVRRIAAVRERACDDFAIHGLADRVAYAETLLNVATRLAKRQRLGLAMAVVRTTKLEQRLAAIEASEGNLRCKSRSGTALATTACILAALVGSLSLRVVRAAPPVPGSPAKPIDVRTDASPTRDTKPQSKPRPKRFDLRDEMRKWVPQLKQADYLAFAGSFDATLKEVLPPEKLANSIAELEQAYGKLQLVQDRWNRRRYGLTWFDILKLKFEQAELELRLFVDEQTGQILSVWIAPPEEAESPIDFDRTKYQFGAAAEKAPLATVTLSAEAIDAEGQPVNARFHFFAEPEPRRDIDALFAVNSFSNWRNITGGGNLEKNLLPGRYRVTATLPRTTGDSSHHTPFGMSEIVELKAGQGDAHVVVRIERGSTLLVRPVDADTGQSLEDVSLSLKRAKDDFPSNWQALPVTEERQPGVFTFDELPAGTYELHGSKRARSPTDVERKLVVTNVFVEIQADKNQELSVKFRAARLDEAAIAKHWPWVAMGRVTDPTGKPLAGATVRAATGYGTLVGGGSTTTNADGRYELRFAEGVMYMDNPVSLQSALIFASKPGHYETNLSRQGQLGMARQQPDEKALKNYASPRFVFLPNEPREVNFTLAKAATLQVELVDEEGEPLRNTNIVLDGETLPPGSSAMEQGDTNHGGDYTFDGVPLGHTWWIYASTGRKVNGRSQAFVLSQPGTYRLQVKLRPAEKPGTHELEVESFRSGGHDVKAEVLRDASTAGSAKASSG